MKMKLTIFCILCCGMFSCRNTGKPDFIFCGSTANDIYQVLKENNFSMQRFTDPDSAVKRAYPGAGVIIVSDSYPSGKTCINDAALTMAAKKKLRLYIEYPRSLQGLNIQDTIIASRLDRGVVISKAFGSSLKPMSILGINDCHVIPVKVDSPLIVIGKVAGFDKAVYGIRDAKTYPVLFRHGNEMIAMTKLSDFATGRYKPSARWREIWTYILTWVAGRKQLNIKSWPSYVHPAYGENEKLPPDAKKQSIVKGVQWYFKAHLFVDSGWREMWLKYQGDGTHPVGPPVSQKLPVGNGSLGIIEGPASKINYDGTQQYRYWVRADDQGEVSYALSAAASMLDNPSYDKIAINLIDFLFYNSNLRGGEKDDKNSSVFGLIGWAVTHSGVFYGDDNARCMLGIIGASAYMHTNKWSKEIVENILANFRTTGKEGFRGDRLEEADILKHGWRYYWNRDIVNPHPHFESWMWACYLWLYNKTGYRPLLEKTERAISITMKDYPQKWKWTNGLQQERARMILPLAWLVRVDNTSEHRKWLDEVATDLLSFQEPCGAIREELGPPGEGSYGPPKSNKDYGKSEASLIFKNGNPASDMLYTCNFAFFSLNEAYRATGNKRYGKAVEKLSDFLTRIQVSSNKFKDIDGAWFRAFDYKDWDYWASNADAGWGAWATLTGWIQSWIVSTQVLVQRDQSYWQLTKNLKVNQYMKQMVDIMFENN